MQPTLKDYIEGVNKMAVSDLKLLKNAVDRAIEVATKPLLNKVEQKKKEFGEKVKIYVTDENRADLLEFYNYWTETDQTGTKLRYESEKFFDIKRRINTWLKRAEQSKPHYNNASISQPKFRSPLEPIKPKHL